MDMRQQPPSLVGWCVNATANGLLRGCRYSAQRGTYILLGGVESGPAGLAMGGPFYVAVVDIKDGGQACVFEQHHEDPFDATTTMLKAWELLCQTVKEPLEGFKSVAPMPGTPAQ